MGDFSQTPFCYQGEITASKDESMRIRLEPGKDAGELRFGLVIIVPVARTLNSSTSPSPSLFHDASISFHETWRVSLVRLYAISEWACELVDPFVSLEESGRG